MSYSAVGYEDIEMGGKVFREPTHEFAERYVRQGFVRKVFGILSVQLALTAVVSAYIMSSVAVKSYMAQNSWTLWCPFALGFVLILLLVCSEQARRTHPLNLCLLFAFSACESVLVGAVSAQYNTHVVLLAVAMTAGVVFGLVLFTLQTKVDVTGMGGVLYCLLLTLIMGSLVQAFLHLPALHIALCTAGVLLFSIYLIIDIQLLIGNHSVAISPDEYVLAALNIYLDVINIFLYILQLVDELNRN